MDTCAVIAFRSDPLRLTHFRTLPHAPASVRPLPPFVGANRWLKYSTSRIRSRSNCQTPGECTGVCVCQSVRVRIGNIKRAERCFHQCSSSSYQLPTVRTNSARQRQRNIRRRCFCCGRTTSHTRTHHFHWCSCARVYAYKCHIAAG